jgi:peptidyl serine alpha-galactosyltransferase
MFFQVWKSGQTGHVTRVASDCKTDEDAVQLRRVFEQQIQSLPTGRERFHLHITPDFSKTVLPGLDYKFFNKPHGLQHWMHHKLGLPATMNSHKDVVFIILDPDQYILRPFTTADFGADVTSRWKLPNADKAPGGTKYTTKHVVLKHGQPISQMYGFGSRFIEKLNRNISHIVEATRTLAHEKGNNDKESHLYHWTHDETETSYAAGPPYIALGEDMYRIVTTWAAVVAPVYQLSVDHLSEMYAYSAAAAHLELPHFLGYNFMLSDPFTGLEGWDMIDKLSPKEVCLYTQSDANNAQNVAWRNKLPHIMHYCQRYFLGPYFFNKYKLPHEFLSCEHPLVLDPLDDQGVIATKYDSAVTPNNEFNSITPEFAKRHAFFLCHMIARLNEAATYWKQQHCPAATANFSKSYVVPFDKKKH